MAKDRTLVLERGKEGASARMIALRLKRAGVTGLGLETLPDQATDAQWLAWERARTAAGAAQIVGEGVGQAVAAGVADVRGGVPAAYDTLGALYDLFQDAVAPPPPPPAPISKTSPRLTWAGTLRPGTVVTVAPATWTGAAPQRSRRMHREDTPIPAAVLTTYTVTAADVGQRLRVLEIASNVAGGVGTAWSAWTPVVQPWKPLDLQAEGVVFQTLLDPSPATCFVDRARAGASAAVGGEVHGLASLGVGGIHWATRDGSGAPTLELDEGGRYYLRGQGPDDRLLSETPVLPPAPPFTMFGAFRATNQAQGVLFAQRNIENDTTNLDGSTVLRTNTSLLSSSAVYAPGFTALRIWGSTGGASSWPGNPRSLPTGVRHAATFRVEVNAAPALSFAYVDGRLIDTFVAPATFYVGEVSRLFGKWGLASNTDLDLYLLGVMLGVPTALQAARLDDYTAHRAGVPGLEAVLGDTQNNNPPAYLVRNRDTDQHLVARGQHTMGRPASTTKWAPTLQAALWITDWDEQVELLDSDEISGSDSLAEPPEVMAVSDWLFSLNQISGNDAAMLLARVIGRNIRLSLGLTAGTPVEQRAATVEMMNITAAELGMTNTTYVDPHGLSDSNWISCHDLDLLIRAVTARNLDETWVHPVVIPTLADIFHTYTVTAPVPRSYTFLRGAPSLSRLPYVLAQKAGTTPAAGAVEGVLFALPDGSHAIYTSRGGNDDPAVRRPANEALLVQARSFEMVDGWSFPVAA